MTEAQHRRLVRRRGDAEIDANEPAYHRRLVQQLFHSRIRQVEPLLYEVGPQHDRQTHGLPPIACLRIMWTHQPFKPRPWNNLLHLVHKQLTTRLTSVLLEHTLARQTPLLHRSHLTTMRLSNQAEDAELVQSLPRCSRTGLASIPSKGKENPSADIAGLDSS